MLYNNINTLHFSLMRLLWIWSQRKNCLKVNSLKVNDCNPVSETNGLINCLEKVSIHRFPSWGQSQFYYFHESSL